MHPSERLNYSQSSPLVFHEKLVLRHYVIEMLRQCYMTILEVLIFIFVAVLDFVGKVWHLLIC